jgi:hypothetical protein
MSRDFGKNIKTSIISHTYTSGNKCRMPAINVELGNIMSFLTWARYHAPTCKIHAKIRNTPIYTLTDVSRET